MQVALLVQMVPRPPRPGAGRPVKNPVPPPDVANVPPASLPLFWRLSRRGAFPNPVAPRSAKTVCSKTRSALAGTANASSAAVTSNTFFMQGYSSREGNCDSFLWVASSERRSLAKILENYNRYFLDGCSDTNVIAIGGFMLSPDVQRHRIRFSHSTS